MNRGLGLLAVRLARGRVRLLARRVRTVRGALGVGGTTLFLVGFAALQLWRAGDPAMRGASPSAGSLRALVPAMVTVFTLVAAVTERGLFFTPAETGFLFPAPVTRRELLTYNLATRLGVQVLSGLWISIFTVGYAPLPLAGLAAVVLGFVWMYVAAQALALGAAATEAYLSPLVRRVVRVGVIGGLLLLAASAAATAAPGSTGGRFRALLDSPVVRAVSLPARPLGELFAAESSLAAVAWLGASLALTAATLALALAFDVAFIERSLVVGRRTQQRLSRLRSTAPAADGDDAGPIARRFRPRAPRLRLPGGAGPLAWRQLTELLRTPRALLGPLVFGAVWVIAMFGGMRAAEGDDVAAQTSVLTTALLMPVIFGNPLPFDFRRDLDRMAFLRSLPITPRAAALGQVFASALCFAVFEMLVLAGAAALTGAVPAWWLVAAAGLIPPVSWAMAAVENVLFLWMPYRVGPDGRAGAQFLGKALLVMLSKLLTLTLLGAFAAGAWFGVRLLWPLPWLAIAAGCLAMVIPCVPLTLLVGRRFARFDLSRDQAAG